MQLGVARPFPMTVPLPFCSSYGQGAFPFVAVCPGMVVPQEERGILLSAWCHEAALPSGAAGGSGLLELGTTGPCRGLLTGSQGLGHGLASFPSPRDISSGSSLIFEAKLIF